MRIKLATWPTIKQHVIVVIMFPTKSLSDGTTKYEIPTTNKIVIEIPWQIGFTTFLSKKSVSVQSLYLSGEHTIANSEENNGSFVEIAWEDPK